MGTRATYVTMVMLVMMMRMKPGKISRADNWDGHCNLHGNDDDDGGGDVEDERRNVSAL